MGQVAEDAPVVETIEIGRPEILVGSSGLQHLAGGDQDLVGDGDGGAHLASAGGEPAEIVLGACPSNLIFQGSIL